MFFLFVVLFAFPYKNIVNWKIMKFVTNALKDEYEKKISENSQPQDSKFSVFVKKKKNKEIYSYVVIWDLNTDKLKSHPLEKLF